MTEDVPERRGARHPSSPSILLRGLIDYAGVFPPASLAVEEATRRYAEMTRSAHAWILGPMILRSSQLPDQSSKPWSALPGFLALVLDTPTDQIDPAASVQQIELRATAGGVAPITAQALTRTNTVYVESTDPDDLSIVDEISVLRSDGHDVRAKIRTGGVTAPAFPSVDTVARFIETCTALNVPFKATAGLHHPFRHLSDVDGATEHGFINVLSAVRASLAGDGEAVRAALAANDPAEFQPNRAQWRDVGSEVGDADVRSAFRSFGSCSVDEPIGYLASLGLLTGVTR